MLALVVRRHIWLVITKMITKMLMLFLLCDTIACIHTLIGRVFVCLCVCVCVCECVCMCSPNKDWLS